jgi:hypothetical protein
MSVAGGTHAPAETFNLVAIFTARDSTAPKPLQAAVLWNVADPCAVRKQLSARRNGRQTFEKRCCAVILGARVLSGPGSKSNIVRHRDAIGQLCR